MTENFKNFLSNVEQLLRVIPEDKEYFYQIHEKKPLVPELAALFPDGENRIKIPCGPFKSSESNWYDRFKTMFYLFVEKYSDAIDYEAGLVTIDKQQQKLFKAVTAFYLDGYSAEKFDRLKTAGGDELKWIIDNKPTGKLENYVVLSRDPMDFYMASTKQPRSSCISLESSDGRWEGIMNAVADPYRLIAYGVQDGQRVEFSLDSNDLGHNFPSWFKPFTLTADKFVARSWALWDGKGLYLPRWFGSGPSDFKKVKHLDITANRQYRSEPFRAIRCYKEAPIVTPTVYYDNMSTRKDGDDKLFNTLSGSSGTVQSISSGNMRERLANRRG